jgi:eight-cysteine-cluster-containing protein
MKKLVLLVIIAIAVVIFAATGIKPKGAMLVYEVKGCDKQEEAIYRSYKNFEAVELETSENSVILLHQLSYYCCADIHAYLYVLQQQNYTLIRIKEKNEGDACRCVCNYSINMQIKNLIEGLYKVQVVGIEFGDMPTEVLFEKDVWVGRTSIPNPASAYCKEIGGRTEIRRDTQGNEYGICILPNGTECEEWALYRSECKLAFCGWSTFGTCETDDDCLAGGCSGQVCQSKNEEPVVTTCEWRECYDAEAYGVNCRCVSNRCQWR